MPSHPAVWGRLGHCAGVMEEYALTRLYFLSVTLTKRGKTLARAYVPLDAAAYRGMLRDAAT